MDVLVQSRRNAAAAKKFFRRLLAELLPLGRRLHPTTVRRQVQATATRLEDELGEERSCFIDTCQRDREELRARS